LEQGLFVIERETLRVITRLQSNDAYSDWMDVRKAEDILNAEIAEHEQANRWHEFQRDDEEEDGDLSDFTRKPRQ